MSETWPGGLITKNPITPAGPVANGAAPGMWRLNEAEYWVNQGKWPNAALTNGCAVYTAPGGYTWVAPAGVTSVSVVIVGAGGHGSNFGYCYPSSGGGGGGGGALSWRNNISVTPGASYGLYVPAGGAGCSVYAYFNNCTGPLTAGSGSNAYYWVGANGATGRTGNGGGNGGYGGNSCCYLAGGGGGGAGGYGGSGGYGGTGCAGGNGACGGGGGGSGGSYSAGNSYNGGGGGGVGLYGKSCNGAGGPAYQPSTQPGGGGGSGGSSGATGTTGYQSGGGGNYGGGGGGARATYCSSWAGRGASGAVRIVWPGNYRSFPSTNVGP